MTITPEEIAEWRKVCEEATAGPWKFAPETEHVWAAINAPTASDDVCLFPDKDAPPNKADSTFITTARTAMPRLLDELAAKDALIAKYEATLSEIVSVYGNDMDAVVESMMRKQNKGLQARDES